ncbi:hypothetical protein RFI_24885 [Reticulomyxa filosa]|uniref:RING-type domain-containing protein n=1 Tax=Reticulomyxa filosa TaxID=46433 RepID=X6MFQ8_RETFI|nr:hypothetical protein RFI_24885 [Reticulomyxa filosa]|eukprot:ETO12491.1 hypothetical protein RFI_24885 [Reticulomyxa filosa]
MVTRQELKAQKYVLYVNEDWLLTKYRKRFYIWLTKHRVNKMIENEKIKHHSFEKQHQEYNDASLFDSLTSSISVKIAQSLEQKFRSKAKNTNDTSEQLCEKLQTFVESELHQNCCICMELMTPPQKEPVLLIPCSHTFCNQCISKIVNESFENTTKIFYYSNSIRLCGGTKQKDSTAKRKCPLCRQSFNHFVVNVPLKQLIEKLKQKQDDLKKGTPVDSVFNELDQQNQRQNATEVDLLTIREQVLRQELTHVVQEADHHQKNLAHCHLLVNQLKQKDVQLRSALSSLEKELQANQHAILCATQKCDDISHLFKKNSEKKHLIQNVLTDLQQKLDKLRVFQNI